MTQTPLITWLLDTDPALRWQVQRDLLGADETTWQATRARVATEGLGADLLSHQDDDGRWAAGAYFPGGTDWFDGPDAEEHAALPGQPWTATTWSLTMLREWGADPSALRVADTVAALERSARWEYDDLPYWEGEVDCCINAMTLENGLWLGRDMRHLARWFVAHQLADGGWNCEWVEGAEVSSVHSTLNALKGLLAYESAVRSGAAPADDTLPQIRAARRRGEEYLLQRRLMRRLRDGALIGPFITNLAYPLRHVASILNSLTSFRAAHLAETRWAGADSGTGADDSPARPDPRLADAIEALRAQQGPDGRFLQGRVLPGAVWSPIDVPEGEPSPWVTFLGLRILQWWDAEPEAALRLQLEI